MCHILYQSLTLHPYLLINIMSLIYLDILFSYCFDYLHTCIEIIGKKILLYLVGRGGWLWDGVGPANHAYTSVNSLRVVMLTQ